MFRPRIFFQQKRKVHRCYTRLAQGGGLKNPTTSARLRILVGAESLGINGEMLARKVTKLTFPGPDHPLRLEKDAKAMPGNLTALCTLVCVD